MSASGEGRSAEDESACAVVTYRKRTTRCALRTSARIDVNAAQQQTPVFTVVLLAGEIDKGLWVKATDRTRAEGREGARLDPLAPGS